MISFPFTRPLSSSGREYAVLSGCAAGADVPAARTPGRDPEEEDSKVVGRSGSPHLAAVPQDGWTGLLR